MESVMILGQPGAGKSTFARRLGEVTGLPVIHIDRIHWKPGWVERGREKKLAMMREVHRRPRWIFEGGGAATWDDRLAHADTLIWIDLGVWRRYGRVFRRTVRHYGQTRPDLPENCPDRFNWEFTSWIWRTRNTSRAKMAALFEAADLPKHHLRGDRDMARFIAEARLTPRQA